jgi:uncharacterized protein YndB with AHSA1/START domain
VIRFETSVWVERPIEEVFAYVSDPENFPHWSSAVRTVRKTSAGEDEVGSRYSMERDLPTGRAENELEITSHEHPEEFSIRTLSGPTPFVYRYAFSRSDGGTLVELDAEVEFPRRRRLSGTSRKAGSQERRGRQLRHAEARSRDTLSLSRTPHRPPPGRFATRDLAFASVR